MQAVAENIDFVKEEEKILELWKNIDAFQNCLKQSKGKPRYTFYDGPPFATGLPHYGHLLTGTIKDIVPRYAHMSGFHVERRFGWDCHGLPVVSYVYFNDKVLRSFHDQLSLIFRSMRSTKLWELRDPKMS